MVATCNYLCLLSAEYAGSYKANTVTPDMRLCNVNLTVTDIKSNYKGKVDVYDPFSYLSRCLVILNVKSSVLNRQLQGNNDQLFVASRKPLKTWFGFQFCILVHVLECACGLR